jgi:hypothetical protein
MKPTPVSSDSALLSVCVYISVFEGGGEGSTRGRYEVHSISSTADKTDIADVIQGNKFGEINRLMHIMNRDKLDAPELSVDPPDEFIYRCTEILVLFHISPRRHCNLNQNHLPKPQD